MGDHIFKRLGIALVILIIISVFSLAGLYTDFLWFTALGFESIFMITLFTKIKLFFACFGVFFVFALINVLISSRGTKKSFVPFKLKVVVISLISMIFGFIGTSGWFTVLRYMNQTQFGVTDPIFMKDVSFYVFSLPFYTYAWGIGMGAIIVTLILVILDYLQSFIVGSLQKKAEPVTIKSINLRDKAVTHAGFLIVLMFAGLAVKHYLSRFSIMYSEQGIVVGAGYADVTVFLPMIKILMYLAGGLAIIIAFFVIFKKLKRRYLLVYLIIIYLIFGFIGPTVIPAIVQTLKVSPNEINLEKPYIKNNIEFTRKAYRLDSVVEKDFDVVLGLDSEVIEQERQTIDNIRILDWRPLIQTYKQTQEIRLYYDLSGIDIDRYMIDDTYRQVLLAPRELDQTQITDNAQTWVNLHMVYTHGYGVVMSPVNTVTEQGLPSYFIQDIPPIYSVDGVTIDRPQIYYGEKDNMFVLVNTKTPEFDYPKGNTNEYIHYDGEGGVELTSFFVKLMMAIRFKDVKILLSSDITPESRIMFTRNIVERITKVTPFLNLDSDPYFVIDDGKLVWIVDGYTVTGNYPYSEKYGRINYIRNSVKVVVDAYDGTIDYYVVDGTDPLIQTIAKIFPGNFKTFEAMPAKEHIRYPEDLFKIQSQIYSTYHMDDVTVFYNKEDAWQIPKEVYGVGQTVPVEPYYVIMKLPDEDTEEFVLMTSFTPIRKDNMIAWMAARNDGEEYGKLLLYKFPKDKLVYGPLQVEARIDQDSEISQQLTLWSQQGSRVARGNLLVIPIQDSILYVEPLYIQAETGQLPELKRVLVSDGEKVVMEQNLELALQALFGSTPIAVTPEETVDAKELYARIKEAMQEADWVTFGENFEKLGEVLG